MSAASEVVDAWTAERDAISARVAAWAAERRGARNPPHPAPTVPCRPARDDEMGAAARGLVRAVERAGGQAWATYAQGYGLHSRTGRPTELRDSVAVRCLGPGGQRVVAVWTRIVGRDTWTCDARVAWSAERPFGRIGDQAMKAEIASWRIPD
jgi:hypothetical protein